MRLSHFLDRHANDIFHTWEAAAREALGPLSSDAAGADRHLAQEMLLHVARTLSVEGGTDALDDAGPTPPLESPAARHGRARQQLGFTAAELAREFALLRSATLGLWHQHEKNSETSGRAEEALRFTASIDEALVDALGAFSGAAAHSLDTFLAVLGHDLRNPLGSLGGCLELLEKPTLPDFRRRRSAEIARRSVMTIQSMVIDLLEYTRTRLGHGIHISPVWADIAPLCHEAVEEMQAAHPVRTFSIDVSASLEAHFDALRMRQVLGNLLSNAVHHGEPDCQISLCARATANGLAIEVRNRGKLIPPELMQSIFDPLVQIPCAASETDQRPATSLGLGLFIAREIVGAHGGHIEVASSEGDGTSFTVVLPRGE